MKLVSIYFLIAIYSLVGVRFTINHHYCGGKFKAFSVVGFGDHKGCCKGKKMKKGCCDNKQHSLKAKYSSEQSIESLTVPVFFSVIVPEIIPVIQKKEFHYSEKTTPKYIHPPPDAFPPVYLKNCVLII